MFGISSSTVGTIPQWGVFVVVFLAFLKMVIPWRRLNQSSMEAICTALEKQVKILTDRLDHCEEQCRTRDATILGMKKQSIAQQISFARILMKSLGQDNPELRQMLITLEGLEKSFESPVLVEGTK